MVVRYVPPIMETYKLPWTPPEGSGLPDGMYISKRARDRVYASAATIYLPEEAGSQTVPLPELRGREPSAALFFGSRGTSASGVTDHAYLTLGIATSPTDRVSVALVSRDALTTSQCDRRYTDEFVMSPREYGGTGQIESDLSSVSGSALTLSHTGTSTDSYVLNVLGVAGAAIERAEVKQFLLGGSGVGTIDVDLGFDASALVILGASNTAAPPDDQTHVQFSMAFVDKDDRCFGARVFSADARSAESDTSRQFLPGMISGYINWSQSINNRYDWDSWIPDGFRLSRIGTFPNYYAWALALKLRDSSGKSLAAEWVQPTTDSTVHIPVGFRPGAALFFSCGDPTQSTTADTTVTPHNCFFLGAWSSGSGETDTQASCGFFDEDAVSTTNSCSVQSDSSALAMVDSSKAYVGSISVTGKGLGLDLRWTHCDGVQRRGAVLVLGG